MLPLLLESTVDALGPVAPSKDLISVEPESSIKSVLATLAQNGLLSAPVVKDRRVVSVIDTLAIATFIVSQLKHRHIGVADLSKASELLDTPIMAVLETNDLMTRTNYVLLSHTSNLADIVRELTHAHRALLVDEQGLVRRVVTQSDIARFLVANKDKLGFSAMKSLRSLGICLDPKLFKGVLSVPYTATAAEGFNTLTTRQVTGAPVVDADGMMISNISSSQLKGLTIENFGSLFQPILEFCHRVKPITITLQTNFLEMLEKIVNNKIHRVYVMGDEKNPISVVSLTDVMSILCLL